MFDPFYHTNTHVKLTFIYITLIRIESQGEQTSAAMALEKRATRLGELYFEIADHEPCEWPRLLDLSCGKEPELRAELEDLLRISLSTGDFIETPAISEGW